MKTRVTIATVFTKGNKETDGIHNILFFGNPTRQQIAEEVMFSDIFETKSVKVCDTTKIDVEIELTEENSTEPVIDIITSSAHKVADFDHVMI